MNEIFNQSLIISSEGPAGRGSLKVVKEDDDLSFAQTESSVDPDAKGLQELR